MPGQPGQPGQPQYGQPQQSQQNWYAMQYGQPPEDELTRQFNALDADKSGTIAIEELKNFEIGGKKLTFPTIRRIMRVFDLQKTGQITRENFVYLHRFVKDTLDAFNAATSGQQTMSLDQTMAALQRQGLRIKDDIVRSTVKAFRGALTPEQRAAKRADLDFDEYLEIIIHFGLLRSIFEARDPSRSGRVTATLEEFMGIAIEII